MPTVRKVAKKVAARKSAAGKATAKEAPASKVAAKKVAAKKVAAKKVAAKKAPVAKASAKRTRSAASEAPPWETANPKDSTGEPTHHLTPDEKALGQARREEGRPSLSQPDRQHAGHAEEEGVLMPAARKTARPEKDPEGGLTAAGRAAFAAKDGSHLKPGVTKADAEMSPEDMKRKGSWAVRFYGRGSAAAPRRCQGRADALRPFGARLGRAGAEDRVRGAPHRRQGTRASGALCGAADTGEETRGRRSADEGDFHKEGCRQEGGRANRCRRKGEYR